MSKLQILNMQLKDWKIKYANLLVSKEISENNLREEILTYKQALTQKNKQLESLFGTIRKQDAKVAELTKENIILKESSIVQNDHISKLISRIKKNSETSSKPSSTNGFKKPVQNNREKTGNKVGGQLGHKGVGLKLFPNPTKIINKSVPICDCGGATELLKDYISKQLADIKVMLKIFEERVYRSKCVICGKIHIGEFSEEYINPVQYGSNIKALVTILNNHGFVSINKTTDIINSITDNQLNISDATVVNIQKSLSDKLEATMHSIKENLINCNVLNADETGCRVNGKTNWVQVFCNKHFTLFNHNKKRGSASIEDTGILEYFIGILVHDHFSAYYKNSLVTHSECNAHILRYLKSILETFNREWAKEMIELLIDILNRKKAKIALGIDALEPAELEDISVAYSEIIEKGKLAYEEAIKGKKNISFFNDERLLIKRLGEFKDEHLRFITNFEAPFDNNQAERDIRPFKTKMKVSGGFRSEKGVESFSKIFSVFSTLKKNDMNIFKNVCAIFNGEKLTFD